MGGILSIVGRFLLTTLAGYGAGKSLEAVTRPDYVAAEQQQSPENQSLFIRAVNAVGIPAWAFGVLLLALAAFIYKTFFKS